MSLAIYKNGSSSSGQDEIENCFVGDDGSGPIAVDVAGEEGFEDSLRVEVLIDESFVRRKERLDSELRGLGDEGSDPITFDDDVAGDEGSEESLRVEEPIDESFARRKERLDPELSELGEEG